MTTPSRTLLVGSGKIAARLAPLILERGEVFALRRSDAEPPAGVTGIRADLAARLPDGDTLRIGGMPALPDWPSAWTSLKAPAIDVSHVVAVERPGPDGPERLPPEAVGQTVAVLLALDAQDFMAGSDVRWMGAKSLRVIMDDGATIDLQQAPDGEGRYFLRMTSDKLAKANALADRRPRTCRFDQHELLWLRRRL